MIARTLVATLLLSAPIASADTACPAAITDAAKQAVPGASLVKCVAKKSHFEAKMQKPDKSIVEVELSATGEIEEIEEVIATSAIPEVVAKAFAVKYPKTSILKAEKQTKADKSVTYELAFKTDKGLKEATFKADGTFVEEE